LGANPPFPFLFPHNGRKGILGQTSPANVFCVVVCYSFFYFPSLFDVDGGLCLLVFFFSSFERLRGGEEALVSLLERKRRLDYTDYGFFSSVSLFFSSFFFRKEKKKDFFSPEGQSPSP